MKILIVILTNVQFYSYCMNQGDRATYIPGPVRGKLEFEKPALENEEFWILQSTHICDKPMII